MTGEQVNPIPNILTMIRLVAGIVMFCLLAASAGGVPFLAVNSVALEPFQRWGFYVFVIAALTDLFDGLLARKLHAESEWGAILDPIADKILVCGTILGLFTIDTGNPYFALPAAFILFREFAVSALRETAARQGRQGSRQFSGQGQNDHPTGCPRRHVTGPELERLQSAADVDRRGVHDFLRPVADSHDRNPVVGPGLFHRRQKGTVNGTIPEDRQSLIETRSPGLRVFLWLGGNIAYS
jgi:CDP-diacylglycerol--glycerol-3-phosphate 3-phosphatidyltransferase